MLPVEQHAGGHGPGKHLEGGGERAGQGRVVEGLGLVLRVHNAQQDKADGKHPGGVAPHKEGALKPAALVHGRAKVHQGEHHQHHAEQQQHQQGDGVLHNHGDLDGGDAEKHQVVGGCAGNTADHRIVDIMPHSRLLKTQEHDNGDDKGQQIAGQIQPRGVFDPAVGQKSGAGGHQQQGQVPGQGVQHHRGHRLPAHGAALVLIPDQAGLQVAGDVLEALNILGPAPLCADLDEEQPAEDSREDSHRGAGHADVGGVGEAQLRHFRAHRGGGAVAAGEAGGQQESEAVVDLREQP